MIPGQFEYHRPDNLDEAVRLLRQFGENARVVAGGHSLIPMMKLRMALPDHLVDLQDIEELTVIREEGDQLVIGATITQTELISSDLLAGKCPILRETALQIADPQVRNVGTIGGNVANGDPGNDMPAVMQALNASYAITGPNGSRLVAARDYYKGAYVTAIEDGEILTAIRIPVPAEGHGYAYVKQKRKIGDYATAAAAVVLELSGGICNSAAIALTNVADTPLYADAASRAITGTGLEASDISNAVQLAKEIAKPVNDGRGPADFRTHVAGVMAKRALETARGRAAH